MAIWRTLLPMLVPAHESLHLGDKSIKRETAPVGQTCLHPRRTQEEHGTFLSHLSLSLEAKGMGWVRTIGGVIERIGRASGVQHKISHP